MTKPATEGKPRCLFVFVLLFIYSSSVDGVEDDDDAGDVFDDDDDDEDDDDDDDYLHFCQYHVSIHHRRSIFRPSPAAPAALRAKLFHKRILLRLEGSRHLLSEPWAARLEPCSLKPRP